MNTEFVTGVARSAAAVRARVAEWRAQRQRVALVPTMGALHAGHRALMEMAKHQADHVIVSIFVNPKQFGPNEDYAQYPRQEAADLDVLQSVGVDLLYAPPLEAIYPDGFSTNVSVGGSLTAGMEGAHRPGHFDGVATVVAKLLLQVAPDIALFGEKDYQQLQTIRQLTRDLDLPVEIKGIPTVRDAEGLALSSRNAYLSPDELTIARRLNKQLAEIAREAVEDPANINSLRRGARVRLLEAGFDEVDYVELADAETLVPIASLERPARILAAVRIGGTRLIDNLPILSA